MKRIFIAILALGMALALFACGEKITFNTAADLPAGTETLEVFEVGRSGKDYYLKAAVGDQSYTFKLAEDFAALAFEPGVTGAIYMQDYFSPADFYSQWYQEAKKWDELGTAFIFAFAGDELVSLTDTTGYSPPDGPPMEGAELPEGVVYVEEFELQSDPGDNLSAEGGALVLFSALVSLHEDFYTPGDAVTITLTGLDMIDDEDAYLYTIVTPGGESKHAVNYYGAVFVLLDGEYLLLDGPGRGDLIPLDEEQAMFILVELLKAQMGEGMTLFPKCEGEVNGQHAFLIDLGTNTEEKFTAEEHYAVTDDGEVWLLDVLADEWQPAAAG